MARRHFLIKKLAAVEALGSTAVICTEKTGTLTKAEMTVQQVYASGRVHKVTGTGYAPEGRWRTPRRWPTSCGPRRCAATPACSPRCR